MSEAVVANAQLAEEGQSRQIEAGEVGGVEQLFGTMMCVVSGLRDK